MKPSQKGIIRLLHATRYSWMGLLAAWKTEAAFRQELMVFVFLAPGTFILPVSGMERLLMIGSLVAVIIVELLNSAIEAVVDRVGPEFHSLSGQAKDMGSAAVFLALLMAMATWGFILGANFL